MSADRDFMQLVNSRVSIWSPIKKKIYGVQDVINEYGVHPHNFVFYRILDGDASDNIDGIKGLALKTILKLYPEIKEETEFSVDRLLGLAKDKLNEKPMYAKIVENSTVVSRNYMLMQLKEPNFTPSLQLQVSREVERLFDYNKFQFIQKMTASGMHTTIPNYHVWLQEVFYPLSVFATSK
jgi:5'-3' exonuclease